MEFLLHTPWWLHFYVGGLLLHIPCWLFLCGEFLLHIPCYFHFYAGCFSYTSRAGLIIITDYLSGEFLLQPGAFFFSFYRGSLSYSSRAGCIFVWGETPHTSHADFVFMRGVSLTHPVLPSFLSGEFLLHIPCRLRVCVCVCVCVLSVVGKGLSRVIASTAVSSSGTDDRIAAMIWPVSVNHFPHPRDVTPVWKCLTRSVVVLICACADWEKRGAVCLRVCMCVCLMT